MTANLTRGDSYSHLDGKMVAKIGYFPYENGTFLPCECGFSAIQLYSKGMKVFSVKEEKYSQ